MVEKIVRNYYYIMLIIVHNKVSVLQPPTAKQCHTLMLMFQSYPCGNCETGRYCTL